jgi:hypothetical protein
LTRRPLPIASEIKEVVETDFNLRSLSGGIFRGLAASSREWIVQAPTTWGCWPLSSIRWQCRMPLKNRVFLHGYSRCMGGGRTDIVGPCGTLKGESCYIRSRNRKPYFDRHRRQSAGMEMNAQLSSRGRRLTVSILPIPKDPDAVKISNYPTLMFSKRVAGYGCYCYIALYGQ